MTTPTPTGGDDGVSELKNKNAAAGYFTPFFAGHESSVVVTDPSDQEALDAAVVAAFGLTSTENEHEYRQAKPGQIAFLGISSGANSDALTCYGFETDANGNVKSLLLASATDAEYTTTKLYVKEGENGARMRLYTDAACTQLWQHGGASDWYIDALSYIETPEVLVNMYNEYSDSVLTWTGATSIWTQEADDKSLYILPDATSGWTAHAGTGTEFAGDYAAYYTEGRDVLFTSTGAGTIELVGDIEPSSVTVNNALGADYTFTGEGKLTGITRLTKQGEGTLTISTANDYSGGTRLEGGTLVAGNAASLGSGGVEIVNGTLDLSGNVISNNITVAKDAEIVLKNGRTTGTFQTSGISSFIVDNFRVATSSSMLMKGNGSSSVANFVNLVMSDRTTETLQGGYLKSSYLTISGMSEVIVGNSSVNKTGAPVYGGLIYSSGGMTISNNKNITLANNFFTHNYDGYLYGGLLYASKNLVLEKNEDLTIAGNTVSASYADVYGGLLRGGDSLTISETGKVTIFGNNVSTRSGVYGGALASRAVLVSGNGEVRINSNNITNTSTAWGSAGGAIYVNDGYVTFRDNDVLELSGNSATAAAIVSGGAVASYGITVQNNESVTISGNYARSSGNNARGGAFSTPDGGYSGPIYILDNEEVDISGNKVISPSGAMGGAMYSGGGIYIRNNDSVRLRGNVEQQDGNYRLRSIYAGSSLYLQANAGQKIEVYDSLYTAGSLVLNENNAGGEILLSGAYTEADLQTAKNGVAGTMQEITNSRTNTVVGTTTLGGGTLSLEHGAILQTGGFTAAAGSDAMVRMENAVLNSSGYDVSFGSGTILSVGGTNTLTAANLNMGSGSILNIDVRDRNSNLTALALNGNLNLDALEFSVQNADVLAAGKYKLISLGADSHFDVGSWETVVNSVSGVDADKLSWENGTLYYTSENTWVISKTQDAEIIEAPEAGSDIVIGNGVNVELGVCLQGHIGCDKPKHGGRPGNPGQGHAHLKPGNNGNNGNGNGNGNGNNGNGNNGNGNGNGNKKDHGHGSIVIVEGSAYIKNRGDFEGLLEFRGTQEEERHFYTEKDLGVAYITVFTDADAESHMHIAEDKTVTTEGIVGDGKLEMHGAGRMVLNGHDADESSTLYYGTLGVNEGAVRVENDSQAYVAHTEVRGGETNAGMEVGRGATMTGESLSVSGENATLHNDGSITMTEGITVEGGTVKGSGSFSALTLDGGELVVGNSPGLQTYTGDLALNEGVVTFSLADVGTAATADTHDWGAAAYSTIDMGGHALTLSEDVNFVLEIGGAALENLVAQTGNTLIIDMVMIQNIGNLTTDEKTLASIFENLKVVITSDAEGLSADTRFLAGKDITDLLTLDVYGAVSGYGADGNTNVVLTATLTNNGSVTIPEPTTATLSLLALVGLAARRRRK